MDKEWQVVIIGDKASGKNKLFNALRKELYPDEECDKTSKEYSKHMVIEEFLLLKSNFKSKRSGSAIKKSMLMFASMLRQRKTTMTSKLNNILFE